MMNFFKRVHEEFQGFKQGCKQGLHVGFNQGLERSVNKWPLEKKLRVLRGLKHLQGIIEKSIPF